MNTDSSKVFKAVTAIGAALQILSADEQQRALDGVVALLGLKSLTTGTATTFGAGAPAAAGSGGSHSAGAGGGKRISLVEFVKEKKPASNPQAIAVFAAYRQQHEGHEFFSKDDLLPYFAKAKMKSPKKNFSRDYGNAVAEGYIHDEGQQSYLTQSGEEAAATGFEGKAKPRGQAVSKGRAKKG